MDYMGQRAGCGAVARSIGSVLLLCRQLRQFNETYGSLGAVIGFMTWLWISAIVVLLGAELDAENGTPDRTQLDDRNAGAIGQPGCADGGFSGSRTDLGALKHAARGQPSFGPALHAFALSETDVSEKSPKRSEAIHTLAECL